MKISSLDHFAFNKVKFLLNIFFQHLPRNFDRNFRSHFMIVIKKRSKINPSSALFESMPDRINIVKNIVSCVQEKASCHSLKALRSFFVNFSKLSSNNCELRLIIKFFRCNYIRNFYTSKTIFFIVVVVRRTYKGKYFKFLLST